MTTLLPIVVDLDDISDILHQHKDVDDQHDPPLINVEKWARLKHQAISASRYHVPSVSEGDDLGTAMEYLTEKFRCIRPGKEFSQALQATSCALKRQEDRIGLPEDSLFRRLYSPVAATDLIGESSPGYSWGQAVGAVSGLRAFQTGERNHYNYNPIATSLTTSPKFD